MGQSSGCHANQTSANARTTAHVAAARRRRSFKTNGASASGKSFNAEAIDHSTAPTRLRFSHVSTARNVRTAAKNVNWPIHSSRKYGVNASHAAVTRLANRGSANRERARITAMARSDSRNAIQKTYAPQGGNSVSGTPRTNATPGG